MKVPAADELFRPTIVTEETVAEEEDAAEPPLEQPAGKSGEQPARAASGRVRHDEKMTVYLTADELLDIEHARLTLRRAGIGVDRGRLVRTAIALALADLDEHGADSEVARRLSTR